MGLQLVRNIDKVTIFMTGTYIYEEINNGHHPQPSLVSITWIHHLQPLLLDITFSHHLQSSLADNTFSHHITYSHLMQLIS
jgi:hypothetical protein